jgi:hypothetical protein
MTKTLARGLIIILAAGGAFLALIGYGSPGMALLLSVVPLCG